LRPAHVLRRLLSSARSLRDAKHVSLRLWLLSSADSRRRAGLSDLLRRLLSQADSVCDLPEVHGKPSLRTRERQFDA
jgi:hypothetical protein